MTQKRLRGESTRAPVGVYDFYRVANGWSVKFSKRRYCERFRHSRVHRGLDQLDECHWRVVALAGS